MNAGITVLSRINPTLGWKSKTTKSQARRTRTPFRAVKRLCMGIANINARSVSIRELPPWLLVLSKHGFQTLGETRRNG